MLLIINRSIRSGEGEGANARNIPGSPAKPREAEGGSLLTIAGTNSRISRKGYEW